MDTNSAPAAVRRIAAAVVVAMLTAVGTTLW